MWRCLVFVVAVTIWNPAVEAVPQGDNTCQGVVKHPVKVKVNVTEPVTFRTYTWCLRVPPRCSKYVVQMRERVKEQIEMHNRTITVCCRGYVEMESKCVPACPPMTECPNMHCNRTNHCYCSPGYSGVFCNDPCPKGFWGKDCKKPCDCPDGFTCHHLTGDCMLDDKPSVKTTVRRAFTHISSESIPTTLRTVTTLTEQTVSTPPTHSNVLKTISMLTSPPARAMTQKPEMNKIEKSIIPIYQPSNVDNFNPTPGQTSFPDIKPSTSAIKTTTLTTTITTTTTPTTTTTTTTTTTPTTITSIPTTTTTIPTTITTISTTTPSIPTTTTSIPTTTTSIPTTTIPTTTTSIPTTTITIPITTTSIPTTTITIPTTTTSIPTATITIPTTTTSIPTTTTSIPTTTTTTIPTTTTITPTTTNTPITSSTTPTTSTIYTTPTNPLMITKLPNIRDPSDSESIPKTITSIKNVNFEIPTISPFMSLSSQQSSNMPPVDTLIISNDDSFTSFSTEATTTLKTSHQPEIATVPLYVVNQEIKLEIPSNVPLYFDQKTLKLDNPDYETSVSGEKSINGLPSTFSTINEATTSGLIITNDTAQTLQTVANTVPPLIYTGLQSKSIPEPTFKFDTSTILLQPSTHSNYFSQQEATTFSTPDLTTSFIEDSPKLIELSSTKKYLNEKGQPIVFSTSSTSAHFNNPPFTNPVDSPMAPMQTPNRNWNPFIPSPGSTKSHGSLTIPFSVNIPVTEITANVKTDTTTNFFAETLDLETRRVGYANPSIKGTTAQVNPISANPFTKSSLANTFLHSFLQPTDVSMSSHEEHIYGTSFPDTANFFNSVTLKKPYFVDRPFDHKNPHSKEKSVDIFTLMTPSLISSVGTLTKEESKDPREKYVEELTTTSLYKEFVAEHSTHLSSSPSVIDYNANSDKESATIGPTDTHLPSQTPYLIAVTNKPLEEIEKDDHKTENSLILFTTEEVEQHTTKGVFINMEKSIDFTGERKDESLKPALLYPNKFNPRIISAEKGVSVEPGMEESVNILSKNEFISLMKPKSMVRGFSEPSTPLVGQETESGIYDFSTDSSINPSTYSIFDKAVDVTASENLHVNSPRVLDNVITNQDEFENTKVPTTTPLSPKEIHSIVNGKILEEPSNYLPTNNEKSTTTPIYQDFDLRDKTVKSTEEFSVTQQPHSGYIPTNKDFLNLTYILNSINDFTSNTKRGMKQSKSSIYGNPIKVKFTENPALNELVTDAVYDREPSTEVMRPVSVYPTRKHWKQDSNHGSRPLKEKNNGNDSKIIHLNISSHLSFHNPTTKYSSQEYKNVDSSNQRGIGISTPIDGKITTVSIVSTVPELKYQAKRSTKEYLQKTENAFTLNLPVEELVSNPNSDTTDEISHVTTYSSSRVSPEDLRIVSTVPMQPAPESEEVSKKPFRRKDISVPYNELEDVGPNMTAALAAHSSKKDFSINLTTGLLAAVTCILLLGSLVTAIVITFIYCKKEKPIPMESCIMAYEQMNTSDPAAIYSVPKPSLSPEIFFCPTFTHHYAAQINKELRELSYSPTKKENFEPLYTEISTDVTSV